MTMPAPKQASLETGSSPYCRLIQNDCPDLPKLCLLNGECYHCAFEQWLQEVTTEVDYTECSPVLGPLN